MITIVAYTTKCDGFFLSVPLFLAMRNDNEIPCLFPPCLSSVFTAVCEPLGVRGEGHDKGLHLVIIAGCVIRTTCT